MSKIKNKKLSFSSARKDKKIWLVMRLSFILFTLTLLHATASVYSQTVDLDLKEAKIQQVLREIQKQSDYDFVFKSELLRKQQPITLLRNGATVTEILDEIIPKHLEYQVIDKTIVIRKKRKKPMPNILVKGKVVDEFGEGIPGVNILIKGTQIGTITDIDGNYSIDVPDGFTLLVFSFVGFATQEMTIDGRTTIDVTLLEDATSLEEVVVTGYFVMDKESYTGTTAEASGEEIINMGGANLIDNLSLVAPSLQLVQNNALGSDPNAIPEIRIRGESVLNPNISASNLLGDPNLPLFILDNFPVEVQRVMDLDQTRVESVNILIDASATAIYGSRAANGVIIIKTKQPKAGKIQTTYSARIDVDVADVESYNLLSGRELFEMQSRLGMRQQLNNSGYETREIEKLLAAGVETDWLAQPVETVVGQRHTLNLQGGTDEIRYSIDGNYLSRPGVMKKSGRDTYGALIRLIYNPSKNLTFRNSIETNFNNSQDSPYGSFSYYARMPGYLPINNLDGSFTQTYSYRTGQFMQDFVDGSGSLFYNPIFEAEVGNFSRSSYINFINNFEIIWDINDDIRFTSNVGFTRQNNVAEDFDSPFSITFINFDQTQRGKYDYSTTDTRRIIGNGTFTYSHDFDGHTITSNIGSTIEENKAQRFGFASIGYSTNNHDPAFSVGYDTFGEPTSLEETRRSISGFGTLNYNFRGRYQLDGSYSVSGNSSSGSNERYAPYWSIGAGWNMHNESFFPQKNIINKLRVTASYGVTGSLEFSSYQALTTSTYFANFRYLGQVGTELRGIGNKDLRAQTTNETNFAVVFGLFNDRITGRGAMYNRLTTDVVSTIDAPPSLGFSRFTTNLGELENKGFEFNMRFHAIKRQNFNSYFNFSIQQNRKTILSIGNAYDSFNRNANNAGLTDAQYQEALENNGFYTVIDEEGNESQSQIPLAELANSFVVRLVEGGSDDDIFVRQSLGIDPMTGEELFLDAEGKATTDFNRAVIVNAGTTEPDFWGTFGAAFQYKRFNLQATFRYEYGAQTLNQSLIRKVENSDKYGNVDRRVLTEGWFEPGDVVPFKSNIEVNGTFVTQTLTQPSTRFVQDDNFIDFRSLNITYDASKSIATKMKMQSLRFSMNFNNLFYISTVRQERGTSYPFARSFTMGLRASF